ncbi:MAG: tyrosine-type recombinase/integrase [Selenomonadaceae bacterium]|nr:tyrosine-type recombinase/integrase [Selenomonadaceae bacterium]
MGAAGDGPLLSKSKGLPSPDGAVREEIVCTKKNGSFINPECLRWRIRQEGYNSHSFRHTHATVLIENGASPKGVAGRLGHSSTILTQDLYTHNTKKLQQDTAEIFVQTMQTKCRQTPLSRQIKTAPR